MQPIFPFELGHKSRTEQPNLLCLWHMEFHTPAQVCCMLHPPLRRSAMMFHYVRFGIALAERCWTTFFFLWTYIQTIREKGLLFRKARPGITVQHVRNHTRFAWHHRVRERRLGHLSMGAFSGAAPMMKTDDAAELFIRMVCRHEGKRRSIMRCYYNKFLIISGNLRTCTTPWLSPCPRSGGINFQGGSKNTFI